MELKLNGKIEVGETLSLYVNVYSKDMKTEYGMMIVKDGQLVKVLGKTKFLTNEAWPVVKQAFHL